VTDTPMPHAWFTGFGDSALNFRLDAWVDDVTRGLAVQSALRMAIAKKLRDAGVEIPFPQHDIHIRSASEPPAGPKRAGRSRLTCPLAMLDGGGPHASGPGSAQAPAAPAGLRGAGLGA